MSSYLIRRFFQMAIVVLLSTMALYLLLNLAPGGPTSGLNLGATRTTRLSPADIARIESYLGLDKPLALRYLTWLIGDDWLGADWMYLGLSPYKAPKLDEQGNPVFNDEGFRPCVREQFDAMQEEQIASLLDASLVEACAAQISTDDAGVVDKTKYRACLQKEFRDYKKENEVPEEAVTECSGNSDARSACWETSLPEERMNRCDAAMDIIYMAPRRFWPNPGVAYLNPGYALWVWGEETSEDVFKADRVAVGMEGSAPDDVTVIGDIVKQTGRTVEIEPFGGAHRYTVVIDDDAEFEFPASSEVMPRPEDGNWLNVGWLFGSGGLLSKYSGFHSDQRGVLRMDWGTSWKLATGQPVSDMFRSRLGNTVLLMTTATVFSLLLAIPLGIYSAVHQYSKTDYLVTTFSFFGTAMPVFWFGLMMILLFSYLFKQWGEWPLPILGVIAPLALVVAYRVRRSVGGRVDETERLVWILGTLILTLAVLLIGPGPKVNIPLLSMPSGGTRTLKPQAEPGTFLAAINATPNGIIDRVTHIVLPATCLSLLYMAGWSRFMRSSMLEVLRQDYVRTARAKGLHERAVIAKHALRNALIPIVTIVVFQIPGIFSGAVLTETIFSYPGIGRLYFSALGQNDWPIMMIFLFVTAILVVVATLLGDILYTVVDPRIRYN